MFKKIPYLSCLGVLSEPYEAELVVRLRPVLSLAVDSSAVGQEPLRDLDAASHRPPLVDLLPEVHVAAQDVAKLLGLVHLEVGGVLGPAVARMVGGRGRPGAVLRSIETRFFLY